MRLVTSSAAVSVLLTLTFAPAYAGQKGNSGNHGPKTTTTHGPSTAAHSPSAKGPSTTTHGPFAKGAAAKPVKSTTSTKVDTKLAKTDTSTKSPKSKKTDGATTTTTASTSTSSTTTTTGTTTTTPAINFTSGAVGEKLTKNSALRSKIETRLTSLGYAGTAYQAAYGFKNLGQFVAATNVSRNLGLSFEKLKLQMTGLSVKPDGTVLKANVGTDGKVTLVDPALVTNPAPTKSLGQSIQTVKSTVDATAAAQTATTQANAEIAGTTTTAGK
jgi:hypothetical protein